jgi:hypothetical protein
LRWRPPNEEPGHERRELAETRHDPSAEDADHERCGGDADVEATDEHRQGRGHQPVPDGDEEGRTDEHPDLAWDPLPSAHGGACGVDLDHPRSLSALPA